MPVGMFRSEEGWVQVDYGTGNIPIPRSKYDQNKYKPDFDKLPSEAEYWAAEKKKEDDAPRSSLNTFLAARAFEASFNDILAVASST